MYKFIYTNIYSTNIYIYLELSLNCRHLNSQDLIPCHSFPEGMLKLFFCLHKCCPPIITKNLVIAIFQMSLFSLRVPRWNCVYITYNCVPFLLMELYIWEFWRPFSLLQIFCILKTVYVVSCIELFFPVSFLSYLSSLKEIKEFSTKVTSYLNLSH